VTEFGVEAKALSADVEVKPVKVKIAPPQRT